MLHGNLSQCFLRFYYYQQSPFCLHGYLPIHTWCRKSCRGWMCAGLGKASGSSSFEPMIGACTTMTSPVTVENNVSLLLTSQSNKQWIIQMLMKRTWFSTNKTPKTLSAYRKASSRGAYGHDPFWSVFEEHRLDSTTTNITTALFII